MNLCGTGDRGGQRKYGERGSSAVEAALVTPLVMALLFGIVELGFFFKDYLASAGAVRAGVRIASALPRNTTYAQAAADQVALSGGAINFNDVRQLWVYKVKPVCDTCALTNKPVGSLDTSFSGCTMCVKFRWNGTKFEPLSGQPVLEIWQASSQNACNTPTEDPDRIGVYLELEHKPITGFVFKNNLTISEASIMSLETISFLRTCKP